MREEDSYKQARQKETPMKAFKEESRNITDILNRKWEKERKGPGQSLLFESAKPRD